MLNPDGHPILARFLDVAMAGMRPVRARVISWAKGEVLEVGCGTGANFEFYKDIESLVAVEPDPHMRKRAERARTKVGLNAEIIDVSAETLPFDDASFDTVVCSFVLCTIPDPQSAAREMFRVLRQDGVLIFAEHVRAGGQPMQQLQNAITPVWSHFGGGCCLNNDAVAQLKNAGFALEVRSPTRGAQHPFPVVYGVATKPPL